MPDRSSKWAAMEQSCHQKTEMLVKWLSKSWKETLKSKTSLVYLSLMKVLAVRTKRTKKSNRHLKKRSRIRQC